MENIRTTTFAPESAVRVWDLPTRLFHWSLAIGMAVAWASAEAGDAFYSLHLVSGVFVLGLVVFRLIWGLVGTRHARFTDFVRGFGAVRAYLGGLFVGKAPHVLGHNPVGGWMVLALLAASFVVAATGLFVSDDGGTGPLAPLIGRGLAHWMEELHEASAGLVGLLVAVHVAGVLIHGLLTRENLVRAMVTGDKMGDGEPIKAGPVSVGLRAGAVLAVVAALLWALFAAVPARADDDHDRALRALGAGEIRPLSEVLEKVEGLYDGRVVEVELEDEDGRLVYEIKTVTPDGAVIEVEIDARTLAIVGGRGRGVNRTREP